jgi:hypothetical protein
MDAWINKQIPLNTLHRWIAINYGLDPAAVVICNDVAEIQTIAPLIAIVQTDGKDDYPLYIEIVGRYADRDKVIDCVQRLQSLCRYFKCQALTSDEIINPYTYVLVDAKGRCWWVGVDAGMLDDHERFVVAKTYNPPEGSFFIAQPLDEERALSALSKVLGLGRTKIDINTDDLFPVSITEPYNQLYPIIEGEHYNQQVTIGIIREQHEWIPERHSAIRWINHMLIFARLMNQTICIKHRFFTEIKSIPGGSDSEEYCYYWDGKTIQEIIYKTCREKWS